MRAQEFVDEDLTRRGFLRGLGAATMAGAAGSALAQNTDISAAFKNMQQDDPRVRHAKDVADLAKVIYQNMVAERGQPMDRRQQNTWMTIAHEKAAAKFSQYRPGAQPPAKPAAGFPSQGSEYRRSRNIDNFESVAEEQLDELSFLGSECTKDCSGHRAGYEWSKRKGLRQANSLYSPSFNKGAALAVAGK
jgi:hypothetical protein